VKPERSRSERGEGSTIVGLGASDLLTILFPQVVSHPEMTCFVACNLGHGSSCTCIVILESKLEVNMNISLFVRVEREYSNQPVSLLSGQTPRPISE